MVRILVTESLHQDAVAFLRDQGWTVEFLRDRAPRTLAEVVQDYDALIVRSGTRVTAEVLARARRLRVIGRPGAGVDNIDLDAATQAGVLVMNTPGRNSIAAAEHTIMLMLAALRKFFPACTAMKNRTWDRRSFLGRELAGKTVGLIGFGRIGMEVARRLSVFDCAVLAYDPYVPESIPRDMGVALTDLDDLLARSDLVSLHAPGTPETRRLMDERRLQRMRPGAVLINCARGELVDEQALLDALNQGRLAGAALDVFATEPPLDWSLVEHPRVIATPHLGGATLEAQERVALDIARQIRDYLQEGRIQNAVNFPTLPGPVREEIPALMKLAYLLGQIVGGLADFRIRNLSVRFSGGVFAHGSLGPLVSAVLAGCLRSSHGPGVNLINARYFAEERGLRYQETRHPESRLYEHAIAVTAESGARRLALAGTVVSPGMARLIMLQEVYLDVPIRPNMLFFRNDDIPGAVGEIGRTLAEGQVNIGCFALARLPNLQQALGAMTLDSPVPRTTLRSLADLPFVRFVRFVRLQENLPTGRGTDNED